MEEINVHPLQEGTIKEITGHYKLISGVIAEWKVEIETLSPDFKGTIDKVVSAYALQMRCGCCSNEKEHIENTKYLISIFEKTLLDYQSILNKAGLMFVWAAGLHWKEQCSHPKGHFEDNQGYCHECGIAMNPDIIFSCGGQQ